MIINKDNDFRGLNSGDKVKFMYDRMMLFGKIDGYSFIEINHADNIRKQCSMVQFDRYYKTSNKELPFCGMTLHFDLNKDIELCDDGYYLVQSVVGEN